MATLQEKIIKMVDDKVKFVTPDASIEVKTTPSNEDVTELKANAIEFAADIIDLNKDLSEDKQETAIKEQLDLRLPEAMAEATERTFLGNVIPAALEAKGFTRIFNEVEKQIFIKKNGEVVVYNNDNGITEFRFTDSAKTTAIKNFSMGMPVDTNLDNRHVSNNINKVFDRLGFKSLAGGSQSVGATEHTNGIVLESGLGFKLAMTADSVDGETSVLTLFALTQTIGDAKHSATEQISLTHAEAVAIRKGFVDMKQMEEM